MSTEVFWFWASIVCLRFIAESLMQAGEGSVTGRAKRAVGPP